VGVRFELENRKVWMYPNSQSKGDVQWHEIASVP